MVDTDRILIAITIVFIIGGITDMFPQIPPILVIIAGLVLAVVWGTNIKKPIPAKSPSAIDKTPIDFLTEKDNTVQTPVAKHVKEKRVVKPITIKLIIAGFLLFFIPLLTFQWIEMYPPSLWSGLLGILSIISTVLGFLLLLGVLFGAVFYSIW